LLLGNEKMTHFRQHEQYAKLLGWFACGQDILGNIVESISNYKSACYLLEQLTLTKTTFYASCLLNLANLYFKSDTFGVSWDYICKCLGVATSLGSGVKFNFTTALDLELKIRRKLGKRRSSSNSLSHSLSLLERKLIHLHLS
jgi:hypothetical protein